jgi:hypothetical protein
MRGNTDINAVCAMVFKLVETASRNFRKIAGAGLLADVCKGKTYVDGEPEAKKKGK